MRTKFACQESDQKYFFENFKDSDATTSKRSSLNIPDCSAVLENQNNNMDTNEISWLQKFAEDNQKICNSGLFDQNIISNKPANVTNEMKFSFNMNYLNEDRRREEHPFFENGAKHQECQRMNEIPHSTQSYSTKEIRKSEGNILADIQNTETVMRSKNRKESLVGSIKKNPKSRPIHEQVSEYQREIAEATPLCKLEEMNDKLNKVLQKDKSASGLITYEDKENIKKTILKEGTELSHKGFAPMRHQKFEDNSKYFQKFRDSNLPFEPKPKEKSKVVENSSFFSGNVANQSSKFDYTPALQTLFHRLDKTQTGKLSKFNCSTQFIPEEFKFIFGNIFTRIKLKQLVCNKREFLKLCENVINEIDSGETIDLLKTIYPNQRENNSLDRLGKLDVQSSKILTFNEEDWPRFSDAKLSSQKERTQLPFSANQLRKDTTSVENIYRSGSRNQSMNLFTTQYEDSENYKYNKSSNRSVSKNSVIERPPLKKSIVFQSNLPLSYCSKKPITQKDLYESTQSQFNDSSSYKKRGPNISQSIMEEHKRSLDNLNELNKRMESCLNTKLLSEHGRVGYTREQSLTFNELIKHV